MDGHNKTIDKFTIFLQNGSTEVRKEEKMPLTTLLTVESVESSSEE